MDVKVTEAQWERMLTISDWAEKLGKGLIPVKRPEGGASFLVRSLGLFPQGCDEVLGRTLPEAAEGVVWKLMRLARQGVLGEKWLKLTPP